MHQMVRLEDRTRLPTTGSVVVVASEVGEVEGSVEEVLQDTQEAQCVVGSVAEEAFGEAEVAQTVGTVAALGVISELVFVATLMHKLAGVAFVVVEQVPLVVVTVAVDMEMVATGVAATAVVDIGEHRGDVVVVEDMKEDTRREGHRVVHMAALP